MLMNDDILNFILNWISNNTVYDGFLFNFEIILLSSEDIQIKACGGKCPIIGFFDPSIGVLITKLDFYKPCNMSILLHEIVHALQYLTESQLQDVFKEREAYDLQNKFLLDLSKKEGLIDLLNVKKCRSLQLNVLR